MTNFLEKYTNGFPPHYMYLRHENVVYPLKALWAASHRPAVSARTFNSVQAKNGLKKLGFVDAIKIDGDERHMVILDEFHLIRSKTPKIFTADVKAEAVIEGERYRKEVSVIKRNASIVAKAKRELGCNCQVCGFNFSEAYGELGRDFIEAHHIEPLFTRSEVSCLTSVNDFAMLCANCHRMIHKLPDGASVDQLRKVMRKQGRKTG